MQKKKKIYLSICVPTYNRKKLLRRCLESIYLNLKSLNNSCEVIVADNSFKAMNINEIKTYKKKFRNFKYIKNVRNINLNGNLRKLISIAKGKYLHILSDDDILLESYYHTISKNLKKKFGILYLNPIGFYNDKNIYKLFEKNNEIKGLSQINFLKKTNFNLIYLSSCIFNKNYVRKEIFSEIKNSNILQTYLFSDCLFKDNKNIYSERYNIGYQKNNESALLNYQLFISDYFYFINYLVRNKKINLKNKNYLLSSTLKNYYSYIFLIQILRNKNTRIFKKSLDEKYREFKLYNVLFRYVDLFPRIIIIPYLSMLVLMFRLMNGEIVSMLRFLMQIIKYEKTQNS